MSSFLRTAVTTATVVTVLGGLLVVAVGGGDPTAPDAVAATSAQVEDAGGTVDGGLLEAPVQVGPGSAVALLDSLRASYAAGGLPSTQRVVLSRDPFRPVIPRAAAGGDPSDPGAPGDPTDPTDPTDPVDPTDPGTPTDPGAADACSGDDAETVCDGRVVTLDGFTEAGDALVSVDGVQFTVDVNDEFGGSFRVLATNAPCATLLYGDEAFSICTGVTVLK